MEQIETGQDPNAQSADKGQSQELHDCPIEGAKEPAPNGEPDPPDGGG